MILAERGDCEGKGRERKQGTGRDMWKSLVKVWSNDKNFWSKQSAIFATKMFADLHHFSTLATGLKGGGLGSGVSAVADCAAKYKRTEGGVDVCADGNASDNWNNPWQNADGTARTGGWGFYSNGFEGPFTCSSDAFCEKPYKDSKGTF